MVSKNFWEELHVQIKSSYMKYMSYFKKKVLDGFSALQ